MIGQRTKYISDEKNTILEPSWQRKENIIEENKEKRKFIHKLNAFNVK